MGGHQVPEQGPKDDGYDEDGYDESQRAEILEVTRGGPSDGAIQFDLDPDLGQDLEVDDDDDEDYEIDRDAETAETDDEEEPD